MRAFLGVVINMGIINLPELENYWSRAFHNYIPFFGKIFSRRRFLQIFWALHLESITNPNPDLKTRTSRVSNFLDYLNDRFLENFIPDENLAVDESTVGFKGNIGFLVFNPKKPTRWGLRIYVLSDTRTSYISTFIPYFGSITTQGLIRPDLSFTSFQQSAAGNSRNQRVPYLHRPLLYKSDTRRRTFEKKLLFDC